MKKLLLVKTSSMGDLIHTFPALTDLSQHRPDEYEITWLVEESFVDIAKMHPMTKEVIVIGSRRWKKIYSVRKHGESLAHSNRRYATSRGI